MKEENAKNVSVVLPIYNEEGNIASLVEEIAGVLERSALSFEIICVDDGSTDKSLDMLRALSQKDERVVVVPHRKNFGQSAAMATGFRHAKNEIVVTLDSDGQNNPSDIPFLLEKLPEYDCVCGIRKKRRDNWVRKIASRVGNGFRNMLTGDYIEDSGCTLRAIQKECLSEVPVFNGMHRFLPTLLRFKGKRVVEIEVDHRPRTWGKSKYGVLDRALRGILDCLAIRWFKRRAFPLDRIAEGFGKNE